MKRIYTLVVLAVLFISCENKKERNVDLLDRKGPISTTSEWLNAKASIQTLQNDIRKKPTDQKKRLLLALAYMQEARVTGEHPHYYPLANDLLDDVIESASADRNLLFEAMVAKATVQLSLHQFEDALSTAQRAEKIDTTTASLYGVFCDAYVELGDYSKAIDAADRMTSIRPDIRSYSRISYLREIHGDTVGAIAAMKEAIASGVPGLEQTAWARITLGGLHESIGNLAEAEIQYRLALAERPYYAFAIGALGRIEAKRKNYDKSIELLNEASEIMPEFSFQQEIAHVYKITNENSRAESITQDLLESLEEDQDAGHVVDLELANIHVDLLQEADAAYSYAKKEYKIRPKNIDVCKTMAKIYYQKNNLEEANKLIQIASRTNKQDAEMFCLKGLITYKLGKTKDGIELMTKALMIDPFLNEHMLQEMRAVSNNKIATLH
ncbi:MAG TPA: tetratricopeptide repeat protein [Chryseolinea sp.]